MGDKDKFNFEDFYLDSEEDEDLTEDEAVEEGVFADEEAYDELLDLHSDKSTIAVKAEYPYIKVSGFVSKSDIVLKKEISLLSEKIDKLNKELDGKVNSAEFMNIVISVLDNEYVLGRLPLTLDTILLLISGHRYSIFIVRDEDNEIELSNKLMKGLIFT